MAVPTYTNEAVRNSELNILLFLNVNKAKTEMLFALPLQLIVKVFVERPTEFLYY